MAYDLVPLDTSTRQKMLGNYNQLADTILSQQEMDQILARYGLLEDQGLQQANDAAMLQLSQQFSPAYNALRARNYGLYGEGPGITRDYNNLTSGLIGQLTGQRLGLGAESASRKAAAMRALAQQRISGRQALGEQLWGRMLSTKKTPSTGQQIASGALQLGGAALGGAIGGPAGASAGYSAARQFPIGDTGSYYGEGDIPQPQQMPLRPTGQTYYDYGYTLPGQMRRRAY